MQMPPRDDHSLAKYINLFKVSSTAGVMVIVMITHLVYPPHQS